MKKKSTSISKLLILLAGGYFALKYLAGQAGMTIKNAVMVGTPKVTNFNFDLNSASPIITLSIPVTNELPVDIPSNAFTGDVLFNNNKIGEVSYPAMDVPAGTSTNFVSDVALNLGGVLGSIPGIIQNPSLLLEGIKIVGEFVSNGIPIPYSKQVTF